MSIVPENKAVSFICILCVFVMCIFVLIFNKKGTIMTQIFIFPHFGLNIHHTFFLFCNLERICLYNREMILPALLRNDSKINMTKNREIMIFQKNSDMIFLPYLPPLL